MANPFSDNAGVDLSSIYAMSLLGGGAPPVTQPTGTGAPGNTTGSGGTSAGLESVNGGTAPTTGAPGGPTNAFNTPFYQGPNGQQQSPTQLVNAGVPSQYANAAQMVGNFQFGRTPNADPAASPTWFSDPQDPRQQGWSSTMDPHFGPFATADLNLQAAQNQMAYGVYTPTATANIPLPNERGGTGEAHQAVANYYNQQGAAGVLSGPNVLMQVYGPQYGQQAAFADTPVAAGGLGFSPEKINADIAAYYAAQGMTPQPQQGIAPYTGGGAPPAAQGPQPVPIGGGMYGPPTTFPTLNFQPANAGQAAAQAAYQQNTHVTNSPGPTQPPAAAPPQVASGPTAAQQAAVPKLQGYITNLQGVKNPTGVQQAELSAYQQRLAAYGGAPKVSQPSRGSATV